MVQIQSAEGKPRMVDVGDSVSSFVASILYWAVFFSGCVFSSRVIFPRPLVFVSACSFSFPVDRGLAILLHFTDH